MMHRPVRRSTLKRSSSSLYGARHVPSTPELIGGAPGRPPRTRNLDAVRCVTLAVLIVVTFVLYIFLCQLEGSSSAFAPTSRPLMVPLSANPGRSQTIRLPMEMSSPIFIPGPSGMKAHLDTSSHSSHAVEPLRKSDHIQEIMWPSLTTPIPKDANELDEDASVHLVTETNHSCKPPCRFLLPFRIGEQESKARQHLSQLATLAKELNRTLVLPNVGKSRLAVCAKWPFETYYDTPTFTASMGYHATTIGLADFGDWTQDRRAEYTSHFVSMKIKGKGDRHAAEGWEDFMLGKTEIDPKLLSCLEAKLPGLYLSSPSGLSVSFNPGRLKGVDTPSQLVQLFSGAVGRRGSLGSSIVPPDVANVVDFANVDVIVVDYDLRYPIFDEPSAWLYYAPPLYDLADKLAGNARPFLAVHWRMEGVPVQNLAWCAVSLIKVLRSLLEAPGENIRNVWFATDYPLLLDDSTGNEIHDRGRKSSTFKTLTSEHDDAIELVKDAFRRGRELDTYRLTDLSEQLQRQRYIDGRFNIEDELLEDSGIHGILDKLAIVQSMIFVSGSEECSKTSSFSKQIIDGRREAYTTDAQSDIRNVTARSR